MITAYSRGSSIRLPPSLTKSATTPWSRRLTSSMKAGGKDHSRPTIRPTFSVMLPFRMRKAERGTRNKSGKTQ